jgi:hypothetical protein
VAKLNEIFREKILNLLSFVKEGNDENADGKRQRGKTIISLSHGFASELHKLIDTILDARPIIASNYSSVSLNNDIEGFIVGLKFDGTSDKSAKIDSYFKSLLAKYIG